MGSSPDMGDHSTRTPRKSQQVHFERGLFRFAILLVAPGLLISGILVWLQPWATGTKLLLLGAEVLVCILTGGALRDHIVHSLQTLTNVVGALREEDYSVRARSAVSDDALGQLSLEVNALADILAQQRTGAIEATALLQRVVEEVDLPIFAFDPVEKLQLVNSSAERLLHLPAGNMLGRSATELGLQTFLTCHNEALVSLSFTGDTRWFVRRSLFRQKGIPHTLIVLSDVSRALREEELHAWQRLIRVIGHELNNSLTPIKSIAGSLSARLGETNLDPEQRQDFERGLAIIEGRAASLNRFLQAYRKLAQMPDPVPQACSLAELVKRVTALETRVEVKVVPGPDITLTADPDQLEQMLINLLRNAAEAVLEPPVGEDDSRSLTSRSAPVPEITLRWKRNGRNVVVNIEDNGPGLMNPGNVFVPFYTTKPQGSGIGLVLSRQICEAHGGRLELSNRMDRHGCSVTVTLPLAPGSELGAGHASA